jgi:hypothetical protein
MPARLLYTFEGLGMKVQIRPTCNRHQASFERMFEMPMASFGPRQTPAVCFYQLDDIPDPQSYLPIFVDC